MDVDVDEAGAEEGDEEAVDFHWGLPPLVWKLRPLHLGLVSLSFCISPP